MVQDVLSQISLRMKKAVDHFEEEIRSLRTGRAQAGMIDGLSVVYYGVKTPLKQLATIQVPDASSLLIQPWDPKAIGDIEQAIRESNLGLQPTNDGRLVRLNLPPLTAERRNDLVKVLHKMGEESRVELRGIRKEGLDQIQDQEKNNEISEDERFTSIERLNKIIEDHNQQIEVIVKQKEAEILTV